MTALFDVLGGKAYRFNLKFEGTYSALVANLISTSRVKEAAYRRFSRGGR